MRRTYARVVVPRRRLVEVLLRHRGEGAAITAESLAVVIGVRERDNRSIRQAIVELIEAGYPIGSTSVEGRAGYYIRVLHHRDAGRTRAGSLVAAQPRSRTRAAD